MPLLDVELTRAGSELKRVQVKVPSGVLRMIPCAHVHV